MSLTLAGRAAERQKIAEEERQRLEAEEAERQRLKKEHLDAETELLTKERCKPFSFFCQNMGEMIHRLRQPETPLSIPR